MKMERHPTLLHDSGTALGFEQRLRLGKHKNQPDWQTRLTQARREWLADAHDLAIFEMCGKGNTIALSHEEVEVAINWECFRHLFFSDRLHSIWKKMVCEGVHQVVAQMFVRNDAAHDFQSHDRMGFAAPWSSWADDPCFPFKTWLETRDSEEGKFARAIPRAHIAARLLPPDTTQVLPPLQSALNQFSADCRRLVAAEKFQEAHQLMSKPLEAQSICSQDLSLLVMEIDWTTPLEQIESELMQMLKPLWSLHNPDGDLGRKDGPLNFFKGLVIRRRLDRGLDNRDACEGVFKNDARKDLPPAAKGAVKSADDILDGVNNRLSEMLERLSLK